MSYKTTSQHSRFIIEFCSSLFWIGNFY